MIYLTKLDNTRIAIATDDAITQTIESLKTNRDIVGISLIGSTFILAEVQDLVAAINSSKVTTLEMSFSNGIDADGVKALAVALKDSTVTTLNLSSNKICNLGVKALAEELATNTTLTTLLLSNNMFAVDGVRALAKALATNTTLTTLEHNSCSWEKAITPAQDYCDTIAALLADNQARMPVAECLDNPASATIAPLGDATVSDDIAQQ